MGESVETLRQRHAEVGTLVGYILFTNGIAATQANAAIAAIRQRTPSTSPPVQLPPATAPTILMIWATNTQTKTNGSQNMKIHEIVLVQSMLTVD